jgi:endonuclease/exonuclease/phosphatase family metal-dependent hydrolase
MDWVIGTALLVVLGIAGTYGVQAVATDSPTNHARPASEPTDWGSVHEDVAEGTVLDAKQRAAAPAARKAKGKARSAKAAFPRPLELAKRRDRDAPAPTVQVVVSSFNVLGSSHTAGHGRGKRAKASGVARAGGAARLIQGNGVGIVGLQELQWDQAGVLSARLPGYGIYPGRSMGAREAENSIMWRLDMFDVVEARTVTIPYFHGRPRQMPYVKLRSRANGKELWVLNVHNPANTRQWGNNARWRRAAIQREIELIRGLRQAEPDVPVVMTGDMNDRAEFFCPMVGTGLLAASNGGAAGNGSCSPPPATQIDWILGTPGLEWSGYVVDRSALVRWSTDHPMVRSVLTLRASDAVSEAADALAALGD